MKLGIFSMPLHPPEKSPHQAFEEDIEWFSELEDRSFIEVWAGEHLTATWENYPSTDMFLTALARHTTQMKLGTGISCLPLHNPAEIALRVAFLDQLSGGRVLFGVGPGGLTTDKPFMDVDVERQEYVDRFRESLRMILHIWTNNAPYELKGKYWNVTLPDGDNDIGLASPIRTFQKPHPPIAIPGTSPRSSSIRYAGTKGWLAMSVDFLPMENIGYHWKDYCEGSEEAGLEPDLDNWSVARDIFVADTDAEAYDYARNGSMGNAYNRYMLPLLNRSNNLGSMKMTEDMPDSDVTVEYLIDKVWVVGSPETVSEKLQSIREQSGKFGKLLMVAHDLDDKPRWDHSVDLLVNEVVPNMQ